MKYKSKHNNECIQELRGKTACVVTDTGNGLKVKFKSHRCVEQDVYMSLDYAQDDYLLQCLKKWEAQTMADCEAKQREIEEHFG